MTMITDAARKKMGWRSGKTFTAYYKQCVICGNNFKTVPSSSKQTTCSLTCRYEWAKRNRGKTNCKICKKEIFHIASRNKIYCGQKCKMEGLACLRRENYQKKRIFGKWKDSKAQKTYFIEEYRACQICGYNKNLLILEIHHKDRNRKNNHESNLLLLCPNCHTEDHLKESDGQFKNNKGVKK